MKTQDTTTTNKKEVVFKYAFLVALLILCALMLLDSINTNDPFLFQS